MRTLARFTSVSITLLAMGAATVVLGGILLLVYEGSEASRMLRHWRAD